MEERGTMIIYRSLYKACKNLPADLFKEAFSAILAYGLDGEESDLSPEAAAIFELVRPQIDANSKKAQAGRAGAEAKRSKAQANTSTPQAPRKQSEADPKQSEAKCKMLNDKCSNISDPLITSAADPSKDGTSETADCESIPLTDGTEWRPTAAAFAEYEKLYPGVDVPQAFRNMRGWCISNPTRKKTRSGVQRFVTAWLAREQNSAKGGKPPEKKRTRFDNFESHGIDYDALMWQSVGGAKNGD